MTCDRREPVDDGRTPQAGPQHRRVPSGTELSEPRVDQLARSFISPPHLQVVGEVDRRVAEIRSGRPVADRIERGVRRITDDGRRLRVTLDLGAPSDRCATTLALTAPHTIVRVKRSSKPVVFFRKVTVYDC